MIETLSFIGIGAGLGIIKERVHTGREKGIQGAALLVHIAKGFTREIEAVLSKSGPPKPKVTKVQISKEAVKEAVKEVLEERRDKKKDSKVSIKMKEESCPTTKT
jgi:hypothetical protein